MPDMIFETLPFKKTGIWY